MNFIGELFKLKLIHERIAHRVIQQLLKEDTESHKTISKMDLEAAVNLLVTVGHELDRPQAKQWVDQYFQYLVLYAKKMNDKRMEFMVKDLEELRAAGWV